MLNKDKCRKKFKTYDIKSITNLRTSISVKEMISYWALIDTKWKRIAKEYYEVLVNCGLKVSSKNNTINKENIRLVYDDCFVYLRKLKDNMVDAIISDLPYNISKNFWDVEINLQKFWKETLRYCNPNSYK